MQVARVSASFRQGRTTENSTAAGGVPDSASAATELPVGARGPALVAEVVGLFAPSSVDVVVFAPDDAVSDLALDGYVVREHVREPVSGYHVTFRHFFRDARASARALEIPLT